MAKIRKFLNKRLERMSDDEKYGFFDGEGYGTKQAQEMFALRRELAKRMDEFGRDWSAKHAKMIPSYDELNKFGKSEGFNTDKYPYSLGSPRTDHYGIPYKGGKYGLDYTWHSDPSNHSVSIENPKAILRDYEFNKDIRPEYIKWIRWLVDNNHKADYRKQGGKIIKIK